MKPGNLYIEMSTRKITSTTQTETNIFVLKVRKYVVYTTEEVLLKIFWPSAFNFRKKQKKDKLPSNLSGNLR